MFFDARELAPDMVVEADVCIVGAGPAGITLAREFNGRRYDVVLLESGGLTLEAGLQALGQADEIRQHNPLKPKTLRTRRQFGGNASWWGVRTERSANGIRLARLSDIDFERRDWVEHSGWPIGASDLASHYERAQRVFCIEPGSYAAEDWENASAARLPIPGDDIETAVFQFGSGDTFSKHYRRELEQSGNIRVYHHATAVEVETEATGSQVTAVRAASHPGRHFRVRAKCVVLAGGGMACAQLLLLSTGTRPEGLGNRHDLVGRYYMDHPTVWGGNFIPGSRQLFEAMTFYDLRTVRGVPVMGYLQVSDAALRRERLLQLSMMLFPRDRTDYVRRELNERQERAFHAVERLHGSFVRREAPTVGDLRQALRGVDGIAMGALNWAQPSGAHINHGGWSKGVGKDHPYDRFEVIHVVEQPPHRDNRVYLSDRVDELGCRKIAIDWRWHDEDIANTMRAQDLYAAAVERSGLGRLEIPRPEGRLKMRSLSTSHYMGMTRMHADPRQGVVNPRCEVHGVRNLFIASSSVFTTGGFANPTLTIVAVALRVADQVKRRLGGMVEASTDAKEVGGASTAASGPRADMPAPRSAANS